MTQQYEIGMVGLGVMGRNLLLNMADHGYAVAGYDKDLSKVEALRKEAENRAIYGAENMKDFIGSLRPPRVIMMLVPAGRVVDSVIGDVLPLLEKGDLIIDAGNSHFTDTDLRAKDLSEKGINFLGVGVSGGEAGARHGPSMMPGGPREAYERVKPLFEAVSASVGGEPCVTYLGPGSAGHYVKMVHNGIEYGIIQLIAETYDLMKRGMGLSNDELREVYGRWMKTEVNGYLVEITSEIFTREDKKTGKRLIDVILDEAKQKGTGKWTSQDAMELQVPVPTIDAAVSMRDMSALKSEREVAGQLFETPAGSFHGDREGFINQLRDALYVSMILTYAQGMALLGKASAAYNYDLDLQEVARIWRGGCIIRALLLEDIQAAYRAKTDLPNLLMDPHFSQEVMTGQDALRATVTTAVELGIPQACMTAALAYFDSYRSAWLPANLVQAQRDFFGSHTYERVDEKGVFHTEWREKSK
ncbi:MAG: NADP-dependent phosphogluconate dehydrogenase [Candidatus Sulfobium sp.]|jgi:6-phosphogluconate dehydrogenase